MAIKPTDGLSSQIYVDLKTKIEEFKYKPGDRISEATLAKVYDVSRTPIKHSLARLENEELITVKPQVGTFVSKIDTQHIHEFFTIRMLLEVSILDEIMDANNATLIEDLYANIQGQQNLIDMENEEEDIDIARVFWKLDNAFHEIIFESVGKGFIWEFIMSQSSQFNRYRLLTVSKDKTYLQAKINEHLAIVNALAGESKANPKDLYNNHLLETLEATIEDLKQKYPDYIL